MSPDHLEECLNIEFSRMDREIRDRALLINAGIPWAEADTIARLTAQDRAAIANDNERQAA